MYEYKEQKERNRSVRKNGEWKEEKAGNGGVR
jgi:hypothetical protein